MCIFINSWGVGKKENKEIKDSYSTNNTDTFTNTQH